MKAQNGWVLALVAGCLLGTWLMSPLERLHAAPSPELVAELPEVNINKATAAELEGIRGVGPSLAQRIVEYRETHGRFERPEDLIRVAGIGESKLESMEDQITL